MTLYEIGRLCVKVAGRDAGKKCVIVSKVNDNFVLVDGETRRKKVNVKHLELLENIISLKNNASHEEVKAVFHKLGLELVDKKSKKTADRVRKQKKKSVKEAPVKKAAKKAETTEETLAEE